MRRRSFTLGLAALAAAPALPPLRAFAATSIPSTPSVAATTRYATAKLIARAHNSCSPAMLQRLLRVDASVAAELNGMLLKKGVITAAGSNGASMAVNPMNTNCVPIEALKPSNLAQSVAGVRDQLEKISARRVEVQAKTDIDQIPAQEATQKCDYASDDPDPNDAENEKHEAPVEYPVE